MTLLTVNSEDETFNEDQTLLTLYNLAGEESGGFVTFRPHLLHSLNRMLIAHHIMPSPPGDPMPWKSGNSSPPRSDGSERNSVPFRARRRIRQ